MKLRKMQSAARNSILARQHFASFSKKSTSTRHFNPKPPTLQVAKFTPAQRPYPSYTDLFSLLSSPPDLLQAQKLHALLITNGFFSHTCKDRTLGSQLVNVYVKFNDFSNALYVFRMLPQKNTIAWNALLRGYVNMGQFKDAVDLFNLMVKQEGSGFPDNFTYPLVLKACSGLGCIDEGRRVSESIQFSRENDEVKWNVYVECALIDMFCKCGSLEEARQVFEAMPSRDVASWTAMISGAARNGEWDEALRLFGRMKHAGLRPDSVIVAAVLPACGKLGDRGTGMSLQGCALKSGFDNDLYVSNALIDMYCKCVNADEALHVFRRMRYLDEVSWSALIAGFTLNGRFHESIELYLEMKDSNVATDAVIAASVLLGFGNLKLFRQGKELHNYILRRGFESDVVLGSALIDMYSKCDLKREAEHVFESMADRDITIWNSMIVGQASNTDADSAFGTFIRLWACKIRPNCITLLSIIPICARLGTLRHGKAVHSYAIKTSLVRVVSIGNALVDMYCKCGSLSFGRNCFYQMADKSVSTYNTIISGLGMHGCGEQACTIFHQMQEARIEPNGITFVALLSACSHSGLTERGRSLYNSMITDYGIMPNTEHYSCMVDLLGRAGKLDEASDFIARMPVEPHTDVLGSLLSSSRVHNIVEVAEWIGEQIIHKDKQDSGHYVLLSNVYASTERWRDASRVRKIIKERGLMKQSGNSWIELGNSSHVFQAREQMHPEFEKIQVALMGLSLEMKDGHVEDSNIVLHDLLSVSG